MRFNYTYQITYGSGQCYDRSKQQLGIEISQEQYAEIIKKIVQGYAINEIPGMEELVRKMEEEVRFVDKWHNLDGSYRKTPLKKERDIAEIKLLIPEDEMRRIRKMENPVETLTRPTEQITFYRSCDNSSVIISTEQGKVRIRDSRKKGTEMMMDVDHFLERIVGW